MKLQYAGFHKPIGRRGQLQGGKDLDGSPISAEGKPSKRGGAPGHGSHEVHPFCLLFCFVDVILLAFISFLFSAFIHYSRNLTLNLINTCPEASVGSKIQFWIIDTSL